MLRAQRTEQIYLAPAKPRIKPHRITFLPRFRATDAKVNPRRNPNKCSKKNASTKLALSY
ncbi:MAG: hypothetical protein ACJA2X_000708 [Halocynthiibacter sp.]|jgi:hypothetical protein